ncbi:MAG: M56 family metallopeptidase [Rhodanobacter sp.]
MISELAAIDWLGHGWLLLLAFTVGVLMVVALRKPCRHLFGTERGFQLWLLPPLAMLASQLPHAADPATVTLPAVVYAITSAGGALPTSAGASTGINWHTATVLIWLAGMLVSLLRAAWAQRRYRRQLVGAASIIDLPSRWPVLRATRADVGPALIGAWRCRIVLPCDFEHRYDNIEQTLILAHETAHARRRDGWWCLCAQIVAAIFWFHPLAWWAISALRHDQELACDAAVLRQHPAHNHSYAHAMLKTQTALFALPVGCPWSPRHPLTERIAMLKLSQPGRLRRSTGMIVGVCLAAVMAGSVYASSTPPGSYSTTTASTHEYQLGMMIKLSSDGGDASHVTRTSIALCMAPGKSGVVTTRGWTFDATTLPEAKRHVRIDLTVSGADGMAVAHTRLHGALGETLHAEGKSDDGVLQYVVNVTPLAGCPARVTRNATSARMQLVRLVVKNESVRNAAMSLAAKSGLKLVNPGALNDSLMTTHMEEIPVELAMKMFADISNKKAVFEGNQVRFETK